MTAVYIIIYRQRTLPGINEERSVQGQINQTIHTLRSRNDRIHTIHRKLHVATYK